MRTAQEAVHTNLEESRSVYNFVNDLCVKLGANPNDLVPFEKYAAAAQSLSRPASAARALQNGAPNIERADKLVQLIARQKGLSHPTLDAHRRAGRRAARGESEKSRGLSAPGRSHCGRVHDGIPPVVPEGYPGATGKISTGARAIAVLAPAPPDKRSIWPENCRVSDAKM